MALSFYKALDALLAAARPPAPRLTPRDRAWSCRVAADVIAPCDLPACDVSAMDGYAVRSMDVAEASPENPRVLRVSGRTLAGERAAAPLESGHAVRIMTGAPVPAGADEVVELERTQPADAGTVRILGRRGAGGHVRRKGEDVARGAVALPLGHEIGPAEIGLLAALGVDAVLCEPSPRVVILATGDELVDASEEPADGRVRDAASPAIAALVRIYGADLASYARVPDGAAALERAILDAIEAGADLIVTIGGISRGDRDCTAEAALGAGFAEVFREVDMKPGHPTSLFSGGDRRLMLALPGNPAAALIVAELFLRPAILSMRGRKKTVQPMGSVAVPRAFSERPGRVHFVRARVQPDSSGKAWELAELLEGGAARLSSLARANALLWIEGEVKAGDRVRALLLRPDVVRSGWVDGAR